MERKGPARGVMSLELLLAVLFHPRKAGMWHGLGANEEIVRKHGKNKQRIR